MKIGFFSDPHIGLMRSSGTTPKSRYKLQDHMYAEALRAIQVLKETHGCEKVFCLGDLFDRHSNPEYIIKQGAHVAKQCDGVLEGNHDRLNDSDKIGSLQLISDLCLMNNAADNRVFSLTFGEYGAHEYWVNAGDNKVKIYFVPHAATQALFEQSLDEVLACKDKKQGAAHSILCLHCNVGETGDRRAEDEGTTLYLTDDYKEKLLDVFNHILVGHEHLSYEGSGGRLRVLGNTFPCAIGEVGDRYVSVFDTDTCTFEKILFNKQEDYFVEVNVKELMASWVEKTVGAFDQSVRLVKIVGTIPSDLFGEFGRCVKKLWESNDHLFMVNTIGVQVEKASKAKRDENSEWAPKTLPELIEQSIASTPYQGAYAEASDAVRAKNPNASS